MGKGQPPRASERGREKYSISCLSVFASSWLERQAKTQKSIIYQAAGQAWTHIIEVYSCQFIICVIRQIVLNFASADSHSRSEAWDGCLKLAN